MDKIFLARQMNAALRLLAQNLNITDRERMQIADLYPPWEAVRNYTAGKILKYGVNEWGETQLYSVIQEHASQDGWKPGGTPSLYSKIGFTDSGVPIWTQPLGASDAYNQGDRVSHDGKIYVSGADGNVWEPGVYGWAEAEAG